MRRVTIPEAARSLDVDEEVVQNRIKDGQLVACQDPEHRGYVWLRETGEPGPGPNGKTRDGESKPRGGQRSKQPRLPAPDREAGAPGTAVQDQTQDGGSKPRSRQGTRQDRVPAPDREAEATVKTQNRESKPRTSQRAQEVAMLQETVAMLKEELGNRDRQLEQKDTEIQARREEVRELLAVLRDSRVLPPGPSAVPGRSDSIVLSLQSAYILALERVANVFREAAAHCSRLVPRGKGRKSAEESS